MKAKDLMIRDVIAVRSSTPVEEIADLMTRYNSSGIPVIDDAARVIGIVSESDLFLTPPPM